MPRTAALLLTLGLLAATPALPAASVSLEPVADTSLLEFKPHYNLGGNLDLPAGTLGVVAGETRSRMLLRFDLSSLPPASRITQARLQVTVTRRPDGVDGSTAFGLHRLLRAWGEGAQHGDPPGGAEARDGESTWTHRILPEQRWSVPGGEPGVDFLAQPDSTERLLGPGPYEFEFGTAQLVALESWRTDPASNHGWMLLSQVEETPRAARRFAAREHPDPTFRPRLLLDLELQTPPNPPVLTGIERDGALARIHLTAEPAVRYTLEFSESPGLGPWQALGIPGVTNAAGPLTLTDEPGNTPLRFYRVAAER